MLDEGDTYLPHNEMMRNVLDGASDPDTANVALSVKIGDMWTPVTLDAFVPIAIANGTEYGLVAGVWTDNGGRQMRLAKRIRAGQVFINNYGAGGGVELPFGGTGKSGYGREKGFEALYGFSVLKTVAAHHG